MRWQWWHGWVGLDMPSDRNANGRFSRLWTISIGSRALGQFDPISKLIFPLIFGRWAITWCSVKRRVCLWTLSFIVDLIQVSILQRLPAKHYEILSKILECQIEVHLNADFLRCIFCHIFYLFEFCISLVFL